MLNVLDDKAHPKARVRAAEVLAKPGIAPKSSAAKLLETLKEALAASEPDWTLRISLVKALGNIGPGAKSAAPIVAKLVLDLMNDAEARFKDTQQNLANFDSYSDGIAQSLLNVDPELRKIVPDRTWTIVFDRRDAGGDSNFRPKEVDAAWRQIRAALKKRYGQEKP